MIRIRNVNKHFGKRNVLNGITLDVTPGRITSIVGPNGCGKTTLIKCILGLVIADSGQITVRDNPVEGAFEFRRDVGYMPQLANFPVNLSLKELVQMLEDLRGQTASEKDSLIRYFELRSILHQPFGQLSGGTRQKVAAVVAFMFDTPVAILDEPTAGLDPFSSLRFKDLLRTKRADGKTILLVSHFMTEVEQLSDDMAFMAEGALVFAGPVTELKDRTGEPDLERALMRMSEGMHGRQP